jgi:hypothetical protein
VLWDDDAPFDELAATEDAEELCRRLLASPWGWRSSTSHLEAIELLAKVRGTSELPASFVALMVCTCPRWDRVTARLIAAVEDAPRSAGDRGRATPAKGLLGDAGA